MSKHALQQMNYILVTVFTLLVMKSICRMEVFVGWENHLSRPGIPSVRGTESRNKSHVDWQTVHIWIGTVTCTAVFEQANTLHVLYWVTFSHMAMSSSSILYTVIIKIKGNKEDNSFISLASCLDRQCVYQLFNLGGQVLSYFDSYIMCDCLVYCVKVQLVQCEIWFIHAVLPV